MILILGGTTEGRKAVAVCDQAAKGFYYSTKGDRQIVDIVNGITITGGLDECAMESFCTEKGIRLIVDAAHPFAEALHTTVAIVSQRLRLPVVRYERDYPTRDNSLLWFDSYDKAVDYLESNGIDNLLALTGVNTVSKLKRYWLRHNCWFRILDRDESRAIVSKVGFPADRIVYYKKDDVNNNISLFSELKPKAIITKESGLSGGFVDKIKAAKRLNIPILVVKRPTLSQDFVCVHGDNGLRKVIEKIVPSFFDLKTGYTTGTSATAATKAALIALLTGKSQDFANITLPGGERVNIPIFYTRMNDEGVSCCVLKDAGDDPDITNGHEIVSTVCLNTEHSGVCFLQGVGIGRVTLPGLGIEIGSPAINKTPRLMMRREIFKTMRHYRDRLPNESLRTGIDVKISVPKGEEIAKKTFNPKLGIVGGISIIGTSGIVKPFSSEAFIASIRKEMEVARALGCREVVINSGAKSENFIKQRYAELPSQAFIHYGNFIGDALRIASDLRFCRVTMGIMIGKAVKLAEGFLDTHSKKVVMNRDFLIGIARDANCSAECVAAIGGMTMARQLWDIIPEGNGLFFSILLEKCYGVCRPLFGDGDLRILLLNDDGLVVQ